MIQEKNRLRTVAICSDEVEISNVEEREKNLSVMVNFSGRWDQWISAAAEIVRLKRKRKRLFFIIL